MADPSDLEQKLAVIKRSYLSELPKRAIDLRSAWDKAQAESGTDVHLRELHRLVHSLSGSGSTFGCDDLSAKAHALELPLAALIREPGADRGGLAELFEALLTALNAAAK